MKFIKRLILFLIIAGVGIAFYMSNDSRKSPQSDAYIKTDTLYVKVFYCRPYAKNRVIFGSEDANPLQAYGKYWRLGANESTRITVSRSVIFGDELLPAGEYSMYAIPGAEEFKIVLNSEVGKWGYFEPEKSNDILSIHVPVEKSKSYKEQFTIEFTQIPGGALMEFSWTDIEFSVPIHY